MADGTAIEWTDATWNPITGCDIVSPGCINCYAMRLAGTRLKHIKSRLGLTRDTKAGPVWTGEVRFNAEWIDQPLRWKQPRRIFVCAHGDLFAEGVPDEWIDQVFAVMALAPQHTFQVLTKRPARMRDYLSRAAADTAVLRSCREKLRAIGRGERGHLDRIGRLLAADGMPTYSWPLPNVWLGVSAERQKEADERIPDLLATPAAVRFVSAEPLLGPVDFKRICVGESEVTPLDESWEGIKRARFVVDALRGVQSFKWPGLDWIIVGGESGPGARPMHPDWVRSIRDQCAAAGTAFFFKQWGAHKVVFDRDKEDPDWQRCDLYARENPNGRWLNLAGGHGFHGERVVYVVPTHKASAGRMLDGVEHSAFPQVVR